MKTVEIVWDEVSVTTWRTVVLVPDDFDPDDYCLADALANVDPKDCTTELVSFNREDIHTGDFTRTTDQPVPVLDLCGYKWEDQ